VSTVIEVAPEELDQLVRYCAREGITREEAIKRAVGLLVGRDEEAEFQAALDAAFGMWKDHGETTDEYLARIRGEWGA
jgi:predicted RNase H-like HicB family nuclease